MWRLVTCWCPWLACSEVWASPPLSSTAPRGVSAGSARPMLYSSTLSRKRNTTLKCRGSAYTLHFTPFLHHSYTLLTPFLHPYTLHFRSVCMLVLIPLTLDRFLAIVFPFQHRYLITVERSISVVMVTWILPGFLLVFDTVTFLTGHKEVHNYFTITKSLLVIIQMMIIYIWWSN